MKIAKIAFRASIEDGARVVRAVWNSMPIDASAWRSQEAAEAHCLTFEPPCVPEVERDMPTKGSVGIWAGSGARLIVFDGGERWTVDMTIRPSEEAAAQLLSILRREGIEAEVEYAPRPLREFLIDNPHDLDLDQEVWCDNSTCHHESHDSVVWRLEAEVEDYLPGRGCRCSACAHLSHPRGVRGGFLVRLPDGREAAVWSSDDNGRADILEIRDWAGARRQYDKECEDFDAEVGEVS